MLPWFETPLPSRPLVLGDRKCLPPANETPPWPHFAKSKRLRCLPLLQLLTQHRDGTCLFAGEKERLTRSKHDGGDTGELVSHALDSIGARLEDVRLVVSNNHHFRVAPFEKRMPWAVAQGACPESYASGENLLPGAAHAELSHHLAHAWSAAALAPFDSGLIVVMVRSLCMYVGSEQVSG